MFREKLHKDLDGISPDEELLTKVTKLMQEEAQMPKPKIYRCALRYCGMAAAVCMIAVGAVALTNVNSVKTSESASGAGVAYSLDNKTENAAKTAGGEALTADFAVAEAYVCDDAEEPAAYDNAVEDFAEDATDASAEDTGISESFSYAGTEATVAYENSPKEESAEQEGAVLESEERKGILLSEIIYKSETIEKDSYTNGKLIQLAVDYVKEHPETMLNCSLTAETMKATGEDGLYLHIMDSGRREVYILIKESDSLILYRNEFYSVSDELKTEITGYFE